MEAIVDIHNSQNYQQFASLVRMGQIYGIEKLGGLGGYYSELIEDGNTLGMKGSE